MDKNSFAEYFNSNTQKILRSKRRNKYYYSQLRKLIKFHVFPNSSILDIGCGDGELLAAANPSYGVGVDISINLLKYAKSKYPDLHFVCYDADSLVLNRKFDYIIISNVLSYLDDIQGILSYLKNVSHPDTRIILIHYNYAWLPVLRLAELLKLKFKSLPENWVALDDIINFFALSDIEPIKQNFYLLMPINLPLISPLLNRIIAKLPLIRNFDLITLVVARIKPHVSYPPPDYSVSVVVPARNEKGHIEELIQRVPKMGLQTEIIFVEGNSTDDTYGEIKRCIREYKNKMPMKLISQGEGTGKADAVRKGFAEATGDVLMILDADITVPPEDLTRFYNALMFRKGEFINGSRLVYPLQEKSMRFLNILGNKFFSIVFTFILDQQFKDTLCGTKVLFKKDYLKIVENRKFFGDFDPFGDFDLIFGAAKLNLKIVDLPIHYQERKYGTTNIDRFSHGLMLLKMVFFVYRKFKLL